MKRTMDELEKLASELSLDSDDFLTEYKVVRMSDSEGKTTVESFVQEGTPCANCLKAATMIGIFRGNEVNVCNSCNDLLWDAQ
jgi:hypothetical protein